MILKSVFVHIFKKYLGLYAKLLYLDKVIEIPT